MRVTRSILIFSALFMGLSGSISAREYLGPKSSKSEIQTKSEACSPAQAQFEFAVNNVRTAAETAGNTWYDRGNGLPFYEVPEGGGNHAIFAGALWMGGTDPAGNLKLAAIRFRQVGNDFWPGPLTDDGAATTFDETCEEYDRFFNMSRQDVEIHRFYFTLVNQGIDPSTEPLFENGYSIPNTILDWPTHGNTALGQSFNLAPFADLRDPETGEILTTPGLYEPELGDYPLYDLESDIDCRTRLVTDPVPLFGDFSMYWIFNDKGNIHTESQGEPIGMEIQAQMFGFNTNDEINNMTFCNYVLINRGSLTLEETFFAQWVDTDLGNPTDDYVGCDVQRGLGYSYNGSNFDGSSTSGPGYGEQPPAIGIDFFEGPYQDPDGINNNYGIGNNEALNGLGYFNIADTLTILGPDSVIDNERFGMRRFIYHQNASGPQATRGPQIAVEYYQMMRGIWRDSEPMTFGGLGYNPGTPNLVADFMFPGDSDPLFWGTNGVDPQYPQPGGWTEENEGNPAEDRRFLQSAGPFTLDPGEFNNITVGAVYARANTGGPFASVNSLFVADDKAQALFENCFRLLSGPDAPDLTFQELDKELIFYLRNTNALSNNLAEEYIELDPTIPAFNEDGEPQDRFYRFQGYQVYQLRDEEVSTGDLEDPELARLLFQVDVEDFDDNGEPIGQIINYEFDEEIGLSVPVEKVNGQNAGISHSFRVTTDLFAQGDNQLINFKKYYYVAVAYGYNNFEDYNPDPDNPTGQSAPYLVGRSSATGAIVPVVAIPSKHDPRFNGSVINSAYGDGLPVTRIEGTGNGGNELRLTEESVDAIMAGPPYKADRLEYEAGFGPLNAKIVDPLNVKSTDFVIKFYNEKDSTGLYVGDFEDARWFLIDKDNPNDTIFSETTIRVANEQIIPEYGISVEIGQYEFEVANPGAGSEKFLPALLNSSIEFPSGFNWLTGVIDAEGFTYNNWIRAGTTIAEDGGDAESPCYLINGFPVGPFWDDKEGFDTRQVYENVINGTFSPAHLVYSNNCGVGPFNTTAESQARTNTSNRDMTDLSSVQVFITPDKSKWSRVPVFEMQHDAAFAQLGTAKELLRNEAGIKMGLRGALSVDKNGLNQAQGGVDLSEATFDNDQVLDDIVWAEIKEDLDGEIDWIDGNEVFEWQFVMLEYDREYPSLGLIDRDEAGNITYNEDKMIGLSFGMGWFPGFAINVETGERLNMAFAENSFFAGDNGRDMLWNPSNRESLSFIQPVFGGEHYVYIFDNNSLYKDEIADLDIDDGDLPEEMPMYDNGQFAYEALTTGKSSDRRRTYAGIEWVAMPLLNSPDGYLSPEAGLVPGEVIISASVATPYQPYATAADELGDGPYVPNKEGSLPYVPVDSAIALSQNQWYPMYEFSTRGSQAQTFQSSVAEDALDLIDIVPNPYYAYSSYEQSRVDNRVKFVNLPPECKIQVFTINGTLVRILEKDNPNTFLEWDLRNETFIPVAGGIYLIHVSVPGVGERVLKFFMATRPADLRNL
ncbi:MAG: T9SS C-terminal target domain-containing protein [Flavobacteriales bacterium]|nr:T9SS C-terminal target domain-containing protein [Flavobacteriales bacterium]